VIVHRHPPITELQPLFCPPVLESLSAFFPFVVFCLNSLFLLILRHGSSSGFAGDQPLLLSPSSSLLTRVLDMLITPLLQLLVDYCPSCPVPHYHTELLSLSLLNPSWEYHEKVRESRGSVRGIVTAPTSKTPGAPFNSPNNPRIRWDLQQIGLFPPLLFRQWRAFKSGFCLSHLTICKVCFCFQKNKAFQA